MKHLRLALCLGWLVSGCAQVEMPIEPDGIDKMRKSPCACAEIEFEPGSFEWVEAA
ncbi:hypothetical protein [Labrenzia sp. 011]|uniref:hypothetical protein n=1 Tax=Labrenzia sp. 011 TaxID=2171494 RepID=UPI001403550D|nr:hypothetical protein [Labrenzia sp. 011]